MNLLTAAVLFLGVFSACQAPPGEVLIEIQPAHPTTVDDLEMVILSESVDPNGKDAVSYRVQWFQSGTVRKDLDGAAVEADQTAKGEYWRVYVTPTDGTLEGPPASAEVTVLNTVPVVESVEVEPEVPRSGEDVQAVAMGSDVDGDPVTFSFSWSVAGVGTVVEGDTLAAEDTARNQVWTLSATPLDGEGEGDQVALELVIGNTPPEITSVDLTPTEPGTLDTIIASLEATDADGDALTATCDWQVGGVGVFSENVTLPGSSSLEPALTSKGGVIDVVCMPNDGVQEGEAVVSAAVTVANSAPSITGVNIKPDGVFEATTATCTPEGWVDVDEDAAGYVYSWTVNGADPGETGETLTGAHFDKFQVLTCTATPDDGEDTGPSFTSAEVVVENSAPSITAVTLSNAAPQEADVVGALVTGGVDDDGDTISFAYEWYVNGSLVANDTTLDGTWFDRGDTIEVMVTPTDGEEQGLGVMSNTGAAVNTAPELLSLTLAPAELYTEDTVAANLSVSDPDPGDSFTNTYEWFVDGAPVGAGTSSDSLSGATAFDKNQSVHARVTPSDGLDSGSPMTSTPVTVLNSAPGAPVLSLSPAEPEPGVDDVICEAVSATDADADPLTYVFDWLVDGAGWQGTSGQAGSSATFYKENIEPGSTLACSGFATDDEGAIGPTSTESLMIPGGWELVYEERFDSGEGGWTSPICSGVGCPAWSGGQMALLRSWNQLLSPSLGGAASAGTWAIQFDASMTTWTELAIRADVTAACWSDCTTTVAYWDSGTLNVQAEGGAAAAASLDFATGLSGDAVTIRLEADGVAGTTCLYEVVGETYSELLCATGSGPPPSGVLLSFSSPNATSESGTFDNFAFYTK